MGHSAGIVVNAAVVPNIDSTEQSFPFRLLSINAGQVF